MLSTRPNPFLNMTPWAQQQALQQQAALLAAQQQAVQASMFQQTAAPMSAATAAAPMGSAAIAAPQMGTPAANQAVMARPRMRDFPGAMSVQRPPRAPMLPSNLLQNIGAGVRSGLAGAATNPFVNPGAGALSAGAGAVRPLTPQMTAAPAAPQMGAPTLAPPAAASPSPAPAAAAARQPQPGARARADDLAPLSDLASQDIPDPGVRDTSGLSTDGLGPVEPKKFSLLDRLAQGFSSMVTPDESGTSAIERMSPWLSMISNNEAKWLNDPSAGKSGWGQLGEDIAQVNNLGRQRQREDEQLKMAREEFGWNRNAASFADEQRGQERIKWADEKQRKAFVANAILDTSLPEGLRKSLPFMSHQQQSEALSKYYIMGPDGIQRVGDGGEYVKVDWRGNETGTGKFTASGDRQYSLQRAGAYRAAQEGELTRLQRLNTAGKMNKNIMDFQQDTQQLASALPYAQASLRSWSRGLKKPEGFDPNTFAQQDAQLTFSVSKAIQGAGVLTESDIRTLSAASLPTTVESLQKWLTGRGGQIGDVQRYALSQILVSRVGAIENLMRQQYLNSSAELAAVNLRPEDIGVRTPAYLIPREGERAFNSTPSGQTVYVPPDAVADLRRNPTPERKRSFEDAFGLPRGSADQYTR